MYHLPTWRFCFPATLVLRVSTIFSVISLQVNRCRLATNDICNSAIDDVMTSLNLFPVAEVQSEVRDLRLHRNTSVRYIRLFISVHYMSLTVQLEKNFTVIKVIILIDCPVLFWRHTHLFPPLRAVSSCVSSSGGLSSVFSMIRDERSTTNVAFVSMWRCFFFCLGRLLIFYVSEWFWFNWVVWGDRGIHDVVHRRALKTI